MPSLGSKRTNSRRRHSLTKLLLHFDGADGSAFFPDSSQYGHNLLPSADLQVDTAQSKFGGASGLFDGTGDFGTLEYSPDFDFGTGDFTIDFWIRRNGNQDTGIIGEATTSFQYWQIGFNGPTTVAFWGGPATEFAFQFATLTDATWTHLAVVRSGTTITGYKDGVSGGSGTNAAACSPPAGSQIVVGAKGSLRFNGHIDELRISKGVARWTSNFSPPLSPYSPPL